MASFSIPTPNINQVIVKPFLLKVSNSIELTPRVKEYYYLKKKKNNEEYNKNGYDWDNGFIPRL
jgi:hypothetical protein